MEPQEIYRLSVELRKVLKNEAFLKSVELLRKDYENRFFGSRPEDKTAREQAYLQNRALDDLLISMETIIAASAQIEQADDN